MSSVSKDIALTILKNRGTVPGDPQCYAVYLYRNAFNGGDTFKICYTSGDELHFRETGATDGPPIMLWHRHISGDGLSAAGKAMVAGQ